MYDMQGFSERLKVARLKAGFATRRAFADSLGIQAPTYRTYERGERQPDFETLCAIAEATSTSLDHLIRGSQQDYQSIYKKLEPILRKDKEKLHHGWSASEDIIRHLVRFCHGKGDPIQSLDLIFMEYPELYRRKSKAWLE